MTYEKPIGFNHYLPRLLLFILAALLTCVLLQSHLKTPAAMLASSENSLDLSGVWEECVPHTSNSNSIDEDSCEWNERNLPGAIPDTQLSAQRGWVLYRKKFSTPNFCSEPLSACRLIIAEVGDALQLRLNGSVIGQHGGLPPIDRYARHYPVGLDLPPSLLKPSDQENGLELRVRHLKKTQTGVLRGPLALVPANSAIPIAQTLLYQNVLIPFICGLGALLISILSLLSIRLSKISDKRLFAFSRYGLISAIFLISYSSIPREYIPLNVAGYIHFLVRFAMDWAYLELAYSLTHWQPRLRIAFRWVYTIFGVLLSISYVGDPWVSSEMQSFTGFNGAVKLSGYFDFLLIFGSYAYGAAALLATHRRQRTEIIALSLVAAVLALLGTLTFHGYTRFPHFVIFYPLFIILMMGIDLWGDFFFTLEKLRTEVDLGRLASQVAHDIRSPLAALAIAEKDLAVLPEDTRVLIRSAVSRIRDIANHLLEKNSAANQMDNSVQAAQSQITEAMTPQLLSSLIDGLLTEKRMQFRPKMGLKIEGPFEAHSYGLFAKIQLNELKRVLSNLVNNSVEALGDQGNVTIGLDATSEDRIRIQVQDNGQGIPPEILAKLGPRGESHGKAEGSGLGLYHARTSIESWGGTLELQSRVGVGTTVTLTLPKVEAPKWFVAELSFTQGSIVVILDDDETIHRIWQGRAESARLNEYGVQLVHLSTPEELRTWTFEHAQQNLNVRYLLDYELLGFEESGLDLIEELGIAAQSILVTSRYEEPIIRESCLKLQVSLIPKGMAGFVPIRILEPLRKYDALLLDDDPLIGIIWSNAAKNLGKRLLVFSEVEDFFEALHQVERSTSIYIDSNLTKGVKGQDLVPQVATLGFQTIYLATGYEPESFPNIAGLTGVVGKNPPF